MVDFNAGEVQPLPLPIVEHSLDLRGNFVLIQRLELTIKTNHRYHRPAITFEQRRINARPAPASLRERLQGQHPQGRKVRAAVLEGRFMGRGPLSLPDVELLIQWRSVLSFATVEQSNRRQQHNQSSQKNH
ncbi:hypothetical protein D3C84_922050 [compost metagenome]